MQFAADDLLQVGGILGAEAGEEDCGAAAGHDDGSAGHVAERHDKLLHFRIGLAGGCGQAIEAALVELVKVAFCEAAYDVPGGDGRLWNASPAEDVGCAVATGGSGGEEEQPRGEFDGKHLFSASAADSGAVSTEQKVDIAAECGGDVVELLIADGEIPRGATGQQGGGGIPGATSEAGLRWNLFVQDEICAELGLGELLQAGGRSENQVVVIQRDTGAQWFWCGVTETQGQLLVLTWEHGEGIAERGAYHDGVKFVVAVGTSLSDFKEHVEFCGAGHHDGVAACADSATADSGGWCG